MFFLSVGSRTGAIRLTMAGMVLRISGADLLHCWVANSIWLKHTESLITK